MRGKEFMDDMPRIIQEYKKVAVEMLQYSFPGITYQECEAAVDLSIIKRTKDHQVTINNNYKKITSEISLISLADYIITREPIITAYGVMFKKHADTQNPLGKMMEVFMNSRDELKHEMFKYPKGSEDYEKYNLLQLLTKIDTNGIYGALGQYTCMFYNLYVAASITAQGRTCISAAGLQFEMFLANNVKFMYVDEIITFIHNIIHENRKYKDIDILDNNISLGQCFYKIMTTCGFIPTEQECQIIFNILSQQSQEILNRLYYKNNLYEFVNNSKVMNMITDMLCRLNSPYVDPNKAPKEIKNELELFTDILMDYVYYKHQIIDKYDKFKYMPKSIIIVQDTDSCIISLDAWFRFCLKITENMNMPIKMYEYNPIEIIDDIDADPRYEDDPILDVHYYKPINEVEPDYDYDFYDDEMVEMDHMVNPITVMTVQDNFRHSSINIMAYALGKIINDYMIEVTKGFNSYVDGKKCLLIMKNEFLFKRLMALDVKKNYASIMELQEGKKVPLNKQLDTKGLSIDKSTLNDASRKKLKAILYEDILKPENIDQIKLLKDIACMEKNIFNSLSSGKKEYYKPASIKSLTAYENPMRIQGIKASLVWNEIKENAEAIDLTKRNSIFIIKVDINKKNVDKIQLSHPNIYNILLTVMDKPEYKDCISAIAIPRDATLPSWMIEFIDYNTIINDNVCNFPLECVGIHKGKTTVNKTNILRL